MLLMHGDQNSRNEFTCFALKYVDATVAAIPNTITDSASAASLPSHCHARRMRMQQPLFDCRRHWAAMPRRVRAANVPYVADE